MLQDCTEPDPEPLTSHNPQILPPLVEEHRHATEEHPADEDGEPAPQQHHDRRQFRPVKRGPP